MVWPLMHGSICCVALGTLFLSHARKALLAVLSISRRLEQDDAEPMRVQGVYLCSSGRRSTPCRSRKWWTTA